VIRLGADREHRDPDVLERDHSAVHRIAAGGQAVFEKQAPQILRMHAIGHSRLVRVPGGKIRGRIALAK
jgi:hypothetical protein